MFNPIRLACNLLDSFGLPRAAGNLHSDRFIVANESFLRIVGLEKDEISRVALSDVVKIHFGSTDAVKIGRLIPITVCTADEAVTIAVLLVTVRRRYIRLSSPNTCVALNWLGLLARFNRS